MVRRTQFYVLLLKNDAAQVAQTLRGDAEWSH
jgi:hypothetical protein